MISNQYIYNKQKYNNGKIFIGVPALDEHYLIDTIESAYDTAKYPDDIYFGICSQKSGQNKFEDFSKYKNVRCIEVRHQYAIGAALSRMIASSLHYDEKYYMQIDAHTIFAKDWDWYLKSDLNLLLKHVDKPIISQSIGSHTVDAYTDPERKRIKTFNGQESYPFCLKKNINNENIICEDKSRENEEKFLGKFLEHYFCMGGSGLFSLYNFIYDVSYNPWIYFNPEQEFTALRSCTRGYRMFATSRTYVSTLAKDNEYKKIYPNEGQENFYHLDDDDYKNKVNFLKVYMTYEYLCGNSFGFNGAPDKNSYEEYINRSSVDYNEIAIIGENRKLKST